MKTYSLEHNQYKVYILELEDSNYYVGISLNPDLRMEQHIGNIEGGAEFTTLHKPLRRIFLSEEIGYSMTKAEKAEEMVTIELMKLVDMEHVRGSHYSSIYQSKVYQYLGIERIKEIEAERIKRKESFEEWSEKRIRKYFNNLIFEKQAKERHKEIRNNENHGKREYCSVKMCINNKYGRCLKGYSPWKDQALCRQIYSVRI